MPRVTRVDQARIVTQQLTHGVGVALCDRIEEPRAIRRGTPIHLGLEGTPARVAVLLRHREERGCELCLRVRLSENRETIFGELAKEFERSARRQRGVGHRPLPSYGARRPRLTGWKSGCLTVDEQCEVGSTLYADRRPPLRPKPGWYGKAPAAASGVTAACLTAAARSVN